MCVPNPYSIQARRYAESLENTVWTNQLTTLPTGENLSAIFLNCRSSVLWNACTTCGGIVGAVFYYLLHDVLLHTDTHTPPPQHTHTHCIIGYSYATHEPLEQGERNLIVQQTIIYLTDVLP